LGCANHANTRVLELRSTSTTENLEDI
jgi:hypothetical protein